MRTLFFILLCLGSTATVAFAECPNALSDDKGIMMSRAQPTFKETYELKDDSIVKTVNYLNRGKPYSTTQRLINGLLVVERTGKKNTLNVLYKNDHEKIADLPKDKIWRSEIEVFKNGKLIKSGEDVLEYIRPTKVTIGTCIYDVWELKSTTLFDNKFKTYFMKYYSPELKLVLKTVHLNNDDNNTRLSEINFDKILEFKTG